MSELEKQVKTLAEVAKSCNALMAVCKNCIAECEFEDNKATFRGKWVSFEVAEGEIQKLKDFLGIAEERSADLFERIWKANKILLPRNLPSFKPILNDAQFESWAQWLERLRVALEAKTK